QQARQETEKLLDDGMRASAIGQREVAYALLKKATALNPQMDRAWLALAEATADPEEALGYLEKALSLNPEDRQAQLAYETARVQILRKSGDQMAEQIRAQAIQQEVKTEAQKSAPLRRLGVWLMQPTGWRLGWWDRYHKVLVTLILVLALYDLGGFWLYSAANEPPAPTAKTAPIGVPAEDASSGDNPPTPFPTMTPFVFAGRLTPTPLPANLANGVFRPLGPPEVNVRKVVAAKNALFIVTLTGGGDLLRYSSEPDGWQSLKENVSTFAASTSLLAVDSLTAAFYHVAQLETPLLEWSLDNGQTWEDVRELDFVAGINHLSVVPTGTLYFSSDLGRVYRSQDSGLSWHLVSVETGQYRGLVAHIVPFAARPEVVYVVYDSGRIYRSTGDVNTWGEAGYSFEGREKLVSVLVDSQAANLLYALDQAGRVYYSVDSARTWIPLRASNPAEGQPVALLMDPVDHLTLFLIFQKEVFVSPNRGRDWQRLPLPAGTTVTAADIREGTLALGTTAGLLVYGNYR
ncbi:MAG: hypothetical protein HYR71_09840, partial [Chloroflexi bacterium]|nr:hypothetical protein [Chloroflexota bacterium]